MGTRVAPITGPHSLVKRPRQPQNKSALIFR